MPKFRIHRGYGYVGTDDSEIIEVDCLETAEEEAKPFAMERVEWWAEPVEDEAEE